MGKYCAIAVTPKCTAPKRTLGAEQRCTTRGREHHARLQANGDLETMGICDFSCSIRFSQIGLYGTVRTTGGANHCGFNRPEAVMDREMQRAAVIGNIFSPRQMIKKELVPGNRMYVRRGRNPKVQ